jgi:3',5'-cyclic AMP phosphodiesterase CpdA
MKIVAVSDLHGFLPAVPPCDLLLLGGDLCPLRSHKDDYQAAWLDTEFRAWLGGVPARKVVGVAGNHDWVFQRRPDLVPRDLPWTYLQDQLVEWEGWRIYGSPWQPPFCGWAFNLDEAGRRAKWALIPDNTDILVLHGPPRGYGDGVPERGGVRLSGCPHLLRRIQEVRPRLVIYGHIHEGRGVWRLGDTVLANVTRVDAGYDPVYEPWAIELER